MKDRPITKEPQIQVGILTEPQIAFELLTPYQLWGTYCSGVVTYHKIVTGKQVATYDKGKILFGGHAYDTLVFAPVDPATDSFELTDVTIGIHFHWERKENQRFQGGLKFIAEDEKLIAINIIGVEDYLTSVISSEMSATASLELLKAHAVISRSWLLSRSSLSPNPSPVGRGTNSSAYQTADGFSYGFLKEKRAELVNDATEAEQIMWEFLRKKQLGYKFRRQHIVDSYIADFACLEKKLIIEIDGGYHNTPEQIAKDAERTERLSLLGYTVLRFTNDEVIASPESVVKSISASLSLGEDQDEVLKWYERSDHAHFDVCADDHCQRYQGITRASTEKVKQAIEATRGQVLMYEGKICDARFSKCCGGAFEEFQYCWEDVKHPYLTQQRDSKTQTNLPDLRTEAEADRWIRTSLEAFCNTKEKHILSQVLNNYDQETTDFYRWTVSYTQQELSELIKLRSGIDYGQIIDLLPVARGTSGRLWKLKIVGTRRTLTIGKELEIRRTLSPSHLYSSAFVVDKAEIAADGIPARFTLTGAGWGHGVGLCQIGAAVMGEQGYTYDAILLHYYIESTLDKLY